MNKEFLMMKRQQFLLYIMFVVAIVFLLLAVFSFRMPFKMCISVSKIEASIHEVLVVENCGDEAPNFIKTSIDWGDGSTATEGQIGSHKYTKSGTFTIKLLGNGKPVSEKLGTTENVELTVLIK